MYLPIILAGILVLSPASLAEVNNHQKISQPTLSHKDQMGLALMDSLVSQGFKPHLAAGIVGNISQESDFKPSVSGRSGVGLVQWCGYRKRNLMRFAEIHETSWKDPMIQARFIHHELNYGTEAEYLPYLLEADDVNEAAVEVCQHYERARPRTANMSFRKSEAQRYYFLWRKFGKSNKAKP